MNQLSVRLVLLYLLFLYLTPFINRNIEKSKGCYMAVWEYLQLRHFFIWCLMSNLFKYKKYFNKFIRFQTKDDTFSMSSSVGYYLFMAFFYLFGLVIYVSQCPERFKPGKFDIWVFVYIMN